MFHSATLKLTGWYLLILMIISVSFSVAIYQITNTEVSSRLLRLQSNIQDQNPALPHPGDTFRINEVSEASTHLVIGLVYANLVILLGGGAGSYLLARRTLRPIERAHEAQSRFTSDASHELRTPLAVMKTELEVVLRDKHATPEELREVLSSNLEEVEKLARLSEMLLNLSRLDHDKLQTSAVNLQTVTKDVVRMYLPKSKRVSVSPSRAVLVSVNDVAARELISILIDNALKYSPEGSKVTITIRKQDEKGIFTIVNVGLGINAEMLPHVFDRFYQADSARNKNTTNGYGLGLSLAKKIVELHNGDLEATSTPGVSTAFMFSLPIYQKNPSKN